MARVMIIIPAAAPPIIDSLGVDELCALQDPDRARGTERPDIDGELQRWDPTGELDVEGRGRERIDREEKRIRLE